MKRIALSTLLALASTLAAAQANIAPMDCGATPEYPGRLGSDTQKRTFDKAYKAYDKCVRDYVEQRKVAIKANEEAAQKAIDNFNTLVTKMKSDSGEAVEASKATGAASSAPKKQY